MIIGISGKIGSGKDVLGQYLRVKFNYKIVKFADKIKEVSALLTGTDISMHATQQGKQTVLGQWGMTVREFQQRLGTEAMRNGLHKDCWVISTLANYKPCSKWAITDVRFKNEANAILKEGGRLIRILRPNNPFPQSNHQSETDLDEFKFTDTIVNDGNFDMLYQNFHEILKKGNY